MANETVLIVEQEPPVYMTVSNTVGIEKGAVLALSDPNTAATTTGAADSFAGIAAQEKIASDGITQLAVYRRGVFKAVASGSITVGDPVCTDVVPNMLKTARTLTHFTLSGTRIAGYALETCTTGETFLVQIHPICVTAQT